MFKTRLLLFFIPMFLSLPFINRAYFVDDSYFVEIASWLKDHPLEMYDFRTDDAGLQNPGWEKDGFVRMVNPLVHHYFLAGLLKINGEKEWFLRLGCVLLSCFSAIFIFELARRWTENPFVSTFLVLVTPVFWLTSHSLLIDSTLAFFVLGGVYFFIRSHEIESAGLAALSGIFMGLAILTKYPGLFILPLTAAWLALRREKADKKILSAIPWSLALIFLAIYSYVTFLRYGHPHILAASSRMVHVFGWPKLLTFFVFLSGSMLLPLLSWRISPRRLRLVAGLMGIGFMCLFSSSIGGFSLIQGFLLALWLVTSLLSIILFWRVRNEWIYPRDHFIFIWVLGFIGMMLLVMDWVAVRYFAIVAPAFVFMLVRLTEIRWKGGSRSILSACCALVLVFTAMIAYADYKQAQPSRLLTSELKKAGIPGGPRHFYLGDSFTMSYLRKEGWVPCFPDTVFQRGDLILAKEITMPLIWFARKPVVLNKIAVFDYPTRFPIKVMDFQGSAGFYASVWGALPFTFSQSSWERFHLFEVMALKDNEPK